VRSKEEEERETHERRSLAAGFVGKKLDSFGVLRRSELDVERLGDAEEREREGVREGVEGSSTEVRLRSV